MSELQEAGGITLDGGEESPAVESQTQATAEPEQSGADLATDSPEEGKQNTDDGGDIWEGFSDEQKATAQQMAQKGVNKQHFKYREEQRKNAELQERLTALEATQTPAVVGEVDIPPIPDNWDENFDEKLRQREEAIARNARFKANKQGEEDRAVIAQKEQRRQELDRSQKLNDQFMENAKKLNVNQESLQKAQETVIQYGITPELATVILDDPIGALMVQHLAANPLDLHDLINASPVRAGLMLSDVKDKAAALKPKTSSAPDPATTLNGRGAPEKQRGPKGATFE